MVVAHDGWPGPRPTKFQQRPMNNPLITLTTDFGDGSPYVAAMKGVILDTNPQARLVDLSHRIPPQDVRHAAFFLRAAVPYFPAEALHVVVVDPGVGTARALLYVEVGGQRLLAPDNGCWTELAREVTGPSVVRRLADKRYWRQQVSHTFHGRDILAPVAGHLSQGLDPRLLGPLAEDWVRLALPAPVLGPNRLTGEVVFIDDFGNLISNVPDDALAAWRERAVRITIGGHEVCHHVNTYGEAEPGTLAALVSSVGTLEVAVSHGSAAAKLGAKIGSPIVVDLLS
jgi:S-adenosylmethionine hydrolase